MDEMNGIPKEDTSGLYLLTLDKRGIPCLDGKKLTGVRSYTIDVDNPSIATLTVSLYVTLNSEVGLYGGGNDIGGDG